jgi:hypothetical protein
MRELTFKNNKKDNNITAYREAEAIRIKPESSEVAFLEVTYSFSEVLTIAKEINKIIADEIKKPLLEDARKLKDPANMARFTDGELHGKH